MPKAQIQSLLRELKIPQAVWRSKKKTKTNCLQTYLLGFNVSGMQIPHNGYFVGIVAVKKAH